MSKQTLRIALISGGIPLGGSTTFLLNLAGELVRRNIPTLVLSLESDNPYGDDFRRLQIPLYVEDDRAHIFEDRLGSALSTLREFQPDVVVACLGPSSFEVLRYVPSGILRLGMIQSDFPENYPPFVPYVERLEGMIAVSREIETKLRAHQQFGTLPIYYLPYGVDVHAQVPARRPRRPEEGEPIRVLYLGRLCRPQKRVHLFPEILRCLKMSRIPFEWTIAGDGPERQWLQENLPTQNDNVRVRFIGTVRYQDVPALLDEQDIFLLASDAEGLPLSLLEAMAHGVVPVISDLKSGVSEVVNSNVGIAVPPEKTEGYSEAIISLGKDPARLAAMAARGADVVRARYSVEAMTDRWLAVLCEHTKERNPTPWPSGFRVVAPLTSRNALWFTGPMRIFRRYWRRFSAARQQSTRA